ncbi:SLC13 family permease [Engelhardtia mirabilis]|uniref:Inner membrane protein YbiR n=1 Tax=Engelhardtia mirabilis TaxID=2528011 RepID=A0A518BG83_9BACT|nr:Inner membrane protein YbiR [Planctomycetes bacterium Pla133]QDV00307.1 Inner membrane protein YbiR [Planctomycetes bacterium Pla86]
MAFANGLSLATATVQHGVAGAQPDAHAVPQGVTLLFLGLLIAMIACLALEEKLHAKKSVIVGSFALVALLLGTALHLLPFGPVLIDGHAKSIPVYIPGIDWNVVAIILGSSLFVDVVAKSGLFTWIAIVLTKTSGGDPRRLLFFYGLMTVVFSAVLNNVTAMIIVGSLTAVSLDKLERKPLLLSFLLIEGLLTNVGGLLTLISSVPNIIVGSAAGISFVDFFLSASPYVVVTTAATLWLGSRLGQIHGLASDEERAEAAARVAGFDERDGIESRGFFVFGAVMLALFIGTIASASVLPWIDELGLGYVALAFAGIVLLKFKAVADRFYKAIDWDLLAFFAALFVVVDVLEHARVLELIGGGLAHVIELGEVGGSAAILAASALASSVTDNIPLAAVLAKVLESTPGVAGNPDSPLWWSVIFGANLGGNLTPIGSASTLVAVTIMHRHGIPLGFVDFVKRAAPFAALHVALAIAYVLVFLR